MGNYKIKEITEAFSNAIKDAPAHGELTISIHFRNNLAYRFEVIRNESILLANTTSFKETKNENRGRR